MSYADYGPGLYKKQGLRGWVELFLNVIIIFIFLFFLGPGTYVSLHFQSGSAPSFRVQQLMFSIQVSF